MKLDEVKQIPMREVVERYGFRISRSGFIHCPFHANDKGASMKIYAKDFYCHACSAHGDQIDFVMRMDNLSFKEAFMSLGGTYDNEDPKEVSRKIRLAEVERQKKTEAEAEMKRIVKMNSNMLSAIRHGIDYYPPFSDTWCMCQNDLPYVLDEYDRLHGIEVGR